MGSQERLLRTPNALTREYIYIYNFLYYADRQTQRERERERENAYTCVMCTSVYMLFICIWLKNVDL